MDETGQDRRTARPFLVPPPINTPCPCAVCCVLANSFPLLPFLCFASSVLCPCQSPVVAFRVLISLSLILLIRPLHYCPAFHPFKHPFIQNQWLIDSAPRLCLGLCRAPSFSTRLLLAQNEHSRQHRQVAPASLSCGWLPILMVLLDTCKSNDRKPGHETHIISNALSHYTTLHSCYPCFSHSHVYLHQKDPAQR